jgi:ABC-2 type transport system permease protein
VRRIRRPALNTVWTATLLRQRVGLLAWAGVASATLALMAWLEPDVVEIWDDFGLTQTIIGQNPGRSATDQYLSFAAQIVVPIITAYVIVQAAGWVNDLAHGRVELVLAAPVSWSRLIVERLSATLVGALLVTAAGLGGLALAATAVGAALDAAGLLRLTADTVLLTAALAGVALLIVAGLRTTASITALTVLYTASYLLVYLVPLFDWPDWVLRASPFGAYGTPYLEWPAAAGVAVLAAVAVLATLAAAAIARHTPKVA